MSAADRAAARGSAEARHRARTAAVQMLYQWEVGRLSMQEVRESFWDHAADDVAPYSPEQRLFAARLADGVAERVAEIDPLIAEAAEHWRVERMNVMDRLILRLAVFELLHEPATPGRVIINEALELTRAFSTDEAIAFVNGVLDAVRRTLGRE